MFTGRFGLSSGAGGSLTINGGAATNTYNIQATQAGTTTTLNAGSGNDTVNVGSASGKLDNIQGPLAVHAQAGKTYWIAVGSAEFGDNYRPFELDLTSQKPPLE